MRSLIFSLLLIFGFCSQAQAQVQLKLYCAFVDPVGIKEVFVRDGIVPQADQLLLTEKFSDGKVKDTPIAREDYEQGYIWLTAPNVNIERVLALTDGGKWNLIEMAEYSVSYFPAYCVE